MDIALHYWSSTIGISIMGDKYHYNHMIYYPRRTQYVRREEKE